MLWYLVAWSCGGTERSELEEEEEEELAAEEEQEVSPLGRIAFMSDRDGNCEIHVMEADGSNQRRLTDNPGDDRVPSWSP